MWYFLWVPLACVLYTLVVSTHADGSVQHLVLLDDLRLPSPIRLTVRSDFKGVVEFVEADKFQIVLNITAATVEEAYFVQPELIKHRGGLLLQLHKNQPKVWLKYVTLPKIGGVITGLALLCLMISAFYSCWWYRHELVSIMDAIQDDQGQNQPLIYQPGTVDSAKQYAETVVFADGLQRLRSDYSVDGHSSREEIPVQTMSDIRKSTGPKRYVKPKVQRKLSSDDDEDNSPLPKRKLSPKKVQQKLKLQHPNDDTDSGTCVGTVEYSGQSSGDDSFIEPKYRSDRYSRASHYDRGQVLPMSRLDESPNKMTTYWNRSNNAGNVLGCSQSPDYGASADGRLIESRQVDYNRWQHGNDNTKASSHCEQLDKNERSESGALEKSSGGRFEKESILSENEIVESERGPGEDYRRRRDEYGRITTRIGPSLLEDSTAQRQSAQETGKSMPLPNNSEMTLHGNNLPDESKSKLKLLQKQALVPLHHDKSIKDVSSTSDDITKFQLHNASKNKSVSKDRFIVEGKECKETLINGSNFDDCKYSMGHLLPVNPIDKKESSGMNYVKGYKPKSFDESSHIDGNQQKIGIEPSQSQDEENLDESLDTIYIPRPSSTGLENNDEKPCLSTFQPQSSSTIKKAPDGKKGSVRFSDTINDVEHRNTKPAGRGSAVKNIHVATVFSMCVLCLVTGVYCIVGMDTTVTVLVFTPHGYLSNNTVVYFSRERPGHVKTGKYMSPIHFYGSSTNAVLNNGIVSIIQEGASVVVGEVDNAILSDRNAGLCNNTRCEQGCDENSGECICRNGFTKNHLGQCIDVDECVEAVTDCSPYASCDNILGRYRCICGENYYGDGRICKDCREPCEAGKFEVQPCIGENNQRKICKDCRKKCQKNHFIYSKCTPSHDTVCHRCRPQCDKTEYEYVACTSTSNRQCHKIEDLTVPSHSKNVLFEDLRGVTNFLTEVFIEKDTGLPTKDTFIVKRGSGLRVIVKVKYINLNPRVEPLHYMKVSERSLPRRRDVRRQYCPQPLPKYYKLQYTVHSNMTFRLKKKCITTCQNAFYPCQTYKRYGSFPNLIHQSEGRITFACAQQNSLTTVFGLNHRLMKTTLLQTEASPGCSKLRNECDRCTATCASQMGNDRRDCKATEHESDNGWSPKLQICYNCCVNKNGCLNVCGNYTRPECSSEKCYLGNIVEFELKPVYPRSDNTFYCSVQPVTNQLLAQIEYSIKFKNTSLVTNSVSVTTRKTWVSRGYVSVSDDLIDVTIDSHIRQMPDVIMGELSSGSILPGLYRHTGPEMFETTRKNYIAIHPKHPFEILNRDWSKVSCSEDILTRFISTDPTSHPFQHMSGLSAAFVKRQTYSLVNASVSPSINIHLPRNKSVLATTFEWTSVYFDSLTGAVMHQDGNWKIVVEGQVIHCPGVFSLNVSDGNRPQHPLFTFDVAVKCPRPFNLNFTMPTGDSLIAKRDFIISIRDIRQTIQMVLQRPKQSQPQHIVPKHASPKSPDLQKTVDIGEQEGRAGESLGNVSVFPLSVPFVAAVCGAIGLLIFMACFGIIMDNGIPDADTVSQLHLRHAVMMVAYITSQILYSLIFSLTTFVLVWITMNSIAMTASSDTTTFLGHYNQQTVLQKTLNSLELGRMQRHLVAEIERQTHIANQTMAKCDANIRQLVTDLEKTQQGLFKSRSKRSHWETVKADIRTHTKYILGNYTKQLLRYRDDFNDVTRYQMQRLIFHIEQTYVSLRDNRWLKGPKYIREAVENLRNLHGAGDTRLLMDWLGMDLNFQQFTRTTDMSMPMPPLPDLNAFVPPNLTWTTAPSHHQDLPPITHIKNHWFSEPRDSIAMDTAPLDSSDLKANTQKVIYEGKSGKFYAFLIVMVLVDVVWLLHRTVKACRVGMLMLYGYPWYQDYRHDPDVNKGCTCCRATRTTPERSLPRLIHKLVHSHFLPKAVMTGMVVLVVYVVLTLNSVYVNKESLSSIGYYNDIDDMLDINEDVINQRIAINARRINDVEYKSHESTLNAYIKRHMLLLEIQHQQLSENGGHIPRMHIVEGHGCRFNRLEPRLYHRRSNAESLLLDQHSDPMIEAASRLIKQTSVLVLAYLAIAVIKQLLDMVIWLYVKRSGLVRLRVIYETNQEPVIQETGQSG